MREELDFSICVEKLEEFSRRIFQHFKKKGVTTVELDVDYYWCIDLKELYDPYNEPNGFSLGQLSDDYESILKRIDGEGGVIGQDAILLAGLLKFLASKHPL